MRQLLFFFGCCWLLTGFSCVGNPSEAIERRFAEPKLAVELGDRAINESSGIARSHRFSERYYTHNDSGDTARFWRFDLTGKISGPFEVTGAKAVDWEDMSSARMGPRSMLYFADIGDNAEKRPSVTIYVVEEPDDGAKSVRAEAFELSYPDGAHNAEAFFVDPSSGAFTIVTKTSKTASRIYMLAGGKSPGRYTLELRGEIEVGQGIDAAKLVTGADISPDGKHVVLRTYLSAYEFDVPPHGAWWQVKPRAIKAAAEAQGEAIAYSLNGHQILTTSEFAPCRVSSILIQSP